MSLAERVLSHRTACFQFKASFSSCTILQLLRYDLDAFDRQLTETINSAPHFFNGALVVLDLEKVQAAGILDFEQIKNKLLAKNMIPVGARGGSEEQHQAAAKRGLPLFNAAKTNTLKPIEKKSSESVNPTLLINRPVRSGMQIYAKGGDLIITGQVSPGAEIMADGHIHIYGPLRGRAMAGVQGNEQARIFCRQLKAELVSIAGYYLTIEDMQSYPQQDGMIQIYLDKQRVHIEAV